MSYALRIRIMHHSAAPARGRAMDYALRIRIMHQLNILSFALASETRDSHHPYTGEMGVRLALACPDCTG